VTKRLADIVTKCKTKKQNIHRYLKRSLFECNNLILVEDTEATGEEHQPDGSRK
jgi:hypothetical protein